MSPSSSPVVSILLTCYQAEEYLERHLDATVAQTIWSDAELVAVSNESTPQERRLLEEFRSGWPDQTQVAFVDRETPYTSWNRCLGVARGEFVAIANADDVRTPEGLAAQVQLLRENKDAVACYGAYRVVDDFGSRQGRDVDPPDFDPVAFSREMRLGPFPVWRRSVDERFDEQFQSGGDYDLAIRLALRGPAVPCSELLGYYLDAGSGLSTSGELPAIERTVVQLRYGVFDTVDYSYLPEALGYDISRIKRDGEWISVADVVPGYDSLIKERSESWLDRGIERHYRRITSPGSRLARDVRGGAGAVKRFFGRLFGR